LGTPTLTAYATGNTFYFVAAATNTTSVTLNVDGLGAKAVTRHGSTALVAGDILTGEVCLVVYDGTRFQLLNPGSYTNLNVSGNLTLNAGTANGVTYLNGSKALTSGSALVFDGTNLGVGTSSPGAKLEVNGNINIQSTGRIGYLAQTDIATVSGATVPNYGISVGTFTGFGGPGVAISGYYGLLFCTNSAEQMRLENSGNLGIGTGGQTARGNLDISSGADAGASTKSIHLGYSAADFYGFRLVNTNTPSFSFAGTFEVQRGNGSTWLSELSVDNAGNVCAGGGNIGTTATNRFLYVPTCAGVPTGTPTAKTGYAPIVVDTTNNKLYFYSGGAWRDAGP
jgi:hypothetical protein